jgi:hypothetical protein
VGIWLRYVGNGVTPVCGLAAFDLANPMNRSRGASGRNWQPGFQGVL